MDVRLWALCLALGMLSSCQQPAAAAASRRHDRGSGADRPPHIIIIVADDLGWNDVGFHGSGQVPTPNIDALAFSGVTLDRYYVQPVCTPSRSALMTGKYPIHTGMQEHVILAAEPYGLSLQETLMPQRLNALGYVSHAVGKWHLGSYKKAYTPTFRGFNSFFGYWTGREDYFDHVCVRHGYWGYDLRRDMEEARGAFGQYSTDLFTQKAVEKIVAHNASRPMFLYLAHLAVHSANEYEPLQAPAASIDKFSHIADGNRRRFAGMLSKLDESVGQVTAALHETGMLDNSVIVFTTDNGGPAASFDFNAASNWPLRGVKSLLWEGGVRGAGFVWSPLLKQRSYVSSNLMHITDLLPTLLSAAGGDPGTLGDIDGIDMWSALSNKLPSPRKEILLNIEPSTGYRALIEGNFKFIEGSSLNEGWSGWFGPSGRNDTRYDLYQLMSTSHAGRAMRQMNMSVTEDQWKTLRSQQSITCQKKPSPRRTCLKTACLFDLLRDPCEYSDLSAAMPAVTSKLRRRMEEFQRGMVPPRNKPVDPRANPKNWGYAWVNWGDLVHPPLP
ncbi:arylsulfatase B-like isoform X2 [Pollicipes pollicipes]|uniref:arylsulfatase B-like isoform X2 n=1 Tax=Pollicipes pollicipes TaxID=41117 RepID=UPI001885A29E|nr:arylsulfatase B-like isoform X2 [Pollicipes pollicipes]